MSITLCPKAVMRRSVKTGRTDSSRKRADADAGCGGGMGYADPFLVRFSRLDWAAPPR